MINECHVGACARAYALFFSLVQLPQHERYLQSKVQVPICIPMVTCDAETDNSVEEIYQNSHIKMFV